MESIMKRFGQFIVNLFKKTKKIVSIPQGKEYDSWLGV